MAAPETVESQPAWVTTGRSSRYAWFVVVALTVAYTVSLVDRSFLGLVIDDIRVDLGLSDFKVALLLGPSFALFYMVLGVPLGWVADRTHRVRLMIAGLTVWCMATAACGLAGGFAGLLLARLLVGVGEATLSPCALSLIADYFPPATRGRAVGVYVSGAVLGGGLGYVFGAQLVDYLGRQTSTRLALLEGLRPWQGSLLIVGLAGLLVIIPLSFIREPRSSGQGNRPDQSAPSMREAARSMLQAWHAYAAVIGSVGFLFIVGYSHLWTVALFQRSWGWSAAQVGTVYGLLIVITALPGTFLGGWLADRAIKAGRKDGPVQSLIYGAAVNGITFGMYPLMPTGELALAWLAFGWFAQALISGAGPAAVIQITPARIRGQASAWYYLSVNLLGLFIGPPIIGGLSDLLGGPQMLRYSVSIVAVVFSVAAIVTLVRARPAYRAATDRGLEAAPLPRAPRREEA